MAKKGYSIRYTFTVFGPKMTWANTPVFCPSYDLTVFAGHPLLPIAPKTRNRKESALPRAVALWHVKTNRLPKILQGLQNSASLSDEKKPRISWHANHIGHYTLDGVWLHWWRQCCCVLLHTTTTTKDGAKISTRLKLWELQRMFVPLSSSKRYRLYNTKE